MHDPPFATDGHAGVMSPCLGGRPITVGSCCLPTTAPMAKSLGIPDLKEADFVSGGIQITYVLEMSMNGTGTYN